MTAGLRRLRSDKPFILCAAGMLILTAVTSFFGAQSGVAMIEQGYFRSLDDYYFQLFPFTALFFAVAVSLFIGVEYGEGTLRNKVMSGHTRARIYLSNWLLCLTEGECITAAWLLGGLSAIPVIGLFSMSSINVFLYILTALFATAALTAVFTLAGMLLSNRTIAVVIAIILAIGLLIGAANCIRPSPPRR
jgi:ABC-type transport system involved in multi-copper enzyme maturation permease subunit